MSDIRSRKCDLIWSLGDYIGEAAQPDSVIDLLYNSGVKMLLGNREESILEYHDGNLPEWDNSLQFSGLLWNYNKLGKRHIEIIKSLKYECDIEIDGIKIRSNHGMQHQIAELVGYSIKDLSQMEEINLLCDKGVRVKRKLVDRLLTELEADIYLCGHSHIPGIVCKNNKMYINPGSVSTPIHVQANVSTYAILTFENKGYSAEIIYIEKNTDAVERDNHLRGYEQAGGKYGQVTLHEMRTGESHIMDFMGYMYKAAEKELGFRPGVIPNEIWRKAAKSWSI